MRFMFEGWYFFALIAGGGVYIGWGLYRGWVKWMRNEERDCSWREGTGKSS